MVIVKDNKHQFSIDGYLKSNLDTAKKVIEKDWDMVICVDGYEGSGKSVLTFQMAYYCDPTFTVDNIVFTPDQFQKAIFDAKPYTAVVFDEGFSGLSSRAAMTQVNRTLIKMMAEIRQKNLFVFVVMPSFFDLDKYICLHRSRCLIHVYTGDNFERGFFAFYNMDKKKLLFIEGKKYYSYKKPRPNFIGRFSNYYPIDQKFYRKLKKDALVGRTKQMEDMAKQKEMEELLWERVLTLGDMVTNKVKAKIMGFTEQNYYYRLRQMEKSNMIH